MYLHDTRNTKSLLFIIFKLRSNIVTVYLYDSFEKGFESTK